MMAHKRPSIYGINFSDFLRVLLPSFGQDRPFQDDNGGEDAIDDVSYHPRQEDALFSGGDSRVVVSVDSSVASSSSSLRRRR